MYDIKKISSGRYFLILAFTGIFGGMLASIGVADAVARHCNRPDDGNGDGFNPIINPGEYKRPTSLPFLFPPDAHIALARQAATDGKLEDAKQHALDALRANPASGEAALSLFDAYTRPSLYRIELPPVEEYAEGEVPTEEIPSPLSPAEPEFVEQDKTQQQIVEVLAAINHSLRPSYITTQSTLADYWLYRQQPARSVPHWHIMLSQYPEMEQDIFPLLQANLDNAAVQVALNPYRETQPDWWQRFLQYHQPYSPL